MCRTDLQNGDFEGTTLGVLSETLLHQPKKKNPPRKKIPGIFAYVKKK